MNVLLALVVVLVQVQEHTYVAFFCGSLVNLSELLKDIFMCSLLFVAEAVKCTTHHIATNV